MQSLCNVPSNVVISVTPADFTRGEDVWREYMRTTAFMREILEEQVSLK